MKEKITAWVARDEAGGLFCFPHGKPIKVDEGDWEMPTKGYWDYDDEELSMGPLNVLSLGEKLFPEVKWEDKEPTEVEITIKTKE